MIVRKLYGRASIGKAKTSREFISARAIRNYKSVDGNISGNILDR